MWLLKNEGKYVETKNLKLGDSIEPFYTRISNESDRINGYEMVLCKNGKWEYTHRIVKNKIYKEQMESLIIRILTKKIIILRIYK